MSAVAESIGVRVVEVGPRDGLQLESTVLGAAKRRELVLRLAGTGLRFLEAASFVSDRLVPQMADADTLIASLPPTKDVVFSSLVLNARGVERALACGASHLRFALAATDSFNERNQGKKIAASLVEFQRCVEATRDRGVTCAAVVAVAFGCPFEGTVQPVWVTELATALFAAGASEVTLADTIGVAVPNQVEDLVADIIESVPGRGVGGHFHDTRNTGIANAVAALRAGANHLDASVGGLGGCPFAPGASGNVATEDLVYCLESMGVGTGVDLTLLLGVGRWLGTVLGRPLQSALLRAGVPSFLDAWAPATAVPATHTEVIL